MKIDLHVHTNSFDTSPDMTPESLVEAALAKGIDGIASTNHDSVEASYPFVEYGRTVGFPVFAGVEVSTDRGHLLIYGLADDTWKRWAQVPSGLPSALDLLDNLDRNGIAVFLAHPFFDSFYPTREALLRFLPAIDGVELENGAKPFVNKLLKEKMKDVDMAGIGGSDAHNPRDVGDAYTDFDGEIGTDRELVAALKAGTFRPVMAKRLHRFFL